MGDVVHLDDYREHFTVEIDGLSVIVPASMIERIAAGTLCISELQSPSLMARCLAIMALGLDDPYDFE